MKPVIDKPPKHEVLYTHLAIMFIYSHTSLSVSVYIQAKLLEWSKTGRNAGPAKFLLIKLIMVGLKICACN